MPREAEAEARSGSALAVFGIGTLPWPVLARRAIAFRADPAGITLGANPAGWLLRRRPAVFVPWADIEGIILYPGRGTLFGQTRHIGIQRGQDAPALPYGNKPGPPLPGTWRGSGSGPADHRLAADRERLAALTAAVAPGITAGQLPG
jgi:hypothetical protein